MPERFKTFMNNVRYLDEGNIYRTVDEFFADLKIMRGKNDIALSIMDSEVNNFFKPQETVITARYTGDRYDCLGVIVLYKYSAVIQLEHLYSFVEYL